MVLCVTDATPEEVVQAAVKLCEKGTEVTVLNVVRLVNDLVKKDTSERFSWVLERLKKAKLKGRLELVESTDVKSAIIDFAKKNKSDVIVTGTIPKRGLVSYFSESVSDYLVKKSPCTVILVRKAGQPV